VSVRLDADLYRLLNSLAEGQGMSLDAYIVTVLSHHVERTLGDGGE
jgi:predicted HicB family RNase H-like nuclease